MWTIEHGPRSPWALRLRLNKTRTMKTKVTSEVDVLRPVPAPQFGVNRVAVPLELSVTPVQGKKIWIDLDNSPHVPFFIPIIDELKQRGFEVIVTGRDIYQVRDLLSFFHLPCVLIGGHYGKRRTLKIIGNCLRAAQLVPIVMRFRPAIALSHGSRAQVLVCKALGVPTVMMHDYEHSTKTGFVSPSWTLMPEIIPHDAMSKNHTLRYPGLKEDVYVPRFRPDPSILALLGISEGEFVVTLRPPATEAHYHNPESETLFIGAVQFLSTKPGVRAVTLPRNAKQKEWLQKKWPELIASGKMIIPALPVDGLNLIWASELVISGGGTMNREAAALGVPVYSIFRGKIGAVDRYLADHGRMTLIQSVEEIETKIKLVRWNRPRMSDERARPALNSIVSYITGILEGTCPATR